MAQLASRLENRCLALFVAVALFSGASPGQASQIEPLAISVAPTPATNTEQLVVTVTGRASCPQLFDPVIFDGVVEIGFSGHCVILPPAVGPFMIHTVLDPLSPGIWELRLLDLDVPVVPPAVADSVTVTVLDPNFSVQLLPSLATEDDEVEAVITGVASYPFVETPEIEPGLIRLRVLECSVCDPPLPPQPFQTEVQLGPLDADEYLVELYYLDDRVAESSLLVLPAGSCIANATTLCLNGGRFRVEASWATPGGNGPAQAVEETADTGLFWFFDPDNIEMVVKVLDACDSGFESFWVFAGGLTDVEVTLDVTDTEHDQTVRYENPLGQPFVTITDTAAFATCP